MGEGWRHWNEQVWGPSTAEGWRHWNEKVWGPSTAEGWRRWNEELGEPEAGQDHVPRSRFDPPSAHG